MKSFALEQKKYINWSINQLLEIFCQLDNSMLLRNFMFQLN